MHLFWLRKYALSFNSLGRSQRKVLLIERVNEILIFENMVSPFIIRELKIIFQILTVDEVESHILQDYYLVFYLIKKSTIVDVIY